MDPSSSATCSLRLTLFVCLALAVNARSTVTEVTVRHGRRDPVKPTVVQVKAAAEDAPCTDIVPPWSYYRCETQADHGQCGESWMEGFCLKSCKKCVDIQEDVLAEEEAVVKPCAKLCKDKPPPFSTVSCETHVRRHAMTEEEMRWSDVQKALGKCEESWMQGFCRCTCGVCAAADIVIKTKPVPSKQTKKDAAPEAKKDIKPKTVKRGQHREILDESKSSSDLKKGHVRFTILHFNDFHSRVEEADNYFGECSPEESSAGRCHGGVARMKTLIDQERDAAAARGESVLLLNPGDDFAGTKWDYHYQGKAVAHFFNQMGIDAMTLGNHEFDYGPDVLGHYIQSLNYSIVSTNLKGNGHWIEGLVQPYVIKEVDGVKVGICGTTTQVTMQWSKPWPVQFDDSTWKARECVEGLQAQGIKIIILLSHEGLNADRYMGRQIKGVDLIIGGHSHSFLYSGETAPAIAHYDTGSMRDETWDSYPAIVDSWIEPERKVYVLQAGWASRYLGRFTVEFNEDGEIVDYDGSPILLGGDASDHPVRENLSWKEDVASYLPDPSLSMTRTVLSFRWRWW